MRFHRALLLACSLILFSSLSFGQAQVYTPDNGNGTYSNPLMWGDWPDPDVIRVGDDFYLISTSMHYVPGSPILHSKDLVNWEMAGYAVDRYDEDPRYDMKGGTLYLNGSWANTLRYHNGKFYVGFCTPYGWGIKDGHFSMCVADSIQGPWKRTIFPEYLYDPGLFFDDDGKVYVVHGQGKLFVTELNEDALSVKSKPVEIWNKGFKSYDSLGGHFGMEGSHVYKINGMYYITCPAGGTEGWQVCLRSKNIYGPYEHKVIMHDDGTYPPNGLHQGGLVQLKNGDWWFVIMQDRGPIGRVPHLEPVVWKDGWPMLGRAGDAKGVVTYNKPDVGKIYSIKVPATSDEFNSPKLGLQWQWNHNPDNTRWSLKDRQGYLRLYGGYAPDLKEARNSLTQRVQGPQSSAITEMEIGHMKDGDIAGLAVFESPYGFVGIRQEGSVRRLVMVNDGKVIDSSAAIHASKVWLKARATSDGYVASFSYSLDDAHFVSLGDSLHMGLGLPWTANRFVLFNFNTIPDSKAGYVDFNWFHFAGDNTRKVSDRISYNGDCISIDGKEVFVYSAAFHYFRTPRPLWKDRLEKIKAAGFNTVETYIPWNIHELNMPAGIDDTSQFDFSELKAFLSLASDSMGLNVIARPGPFICAEWAGGGYPRWLAKYAPKTHADEFWLRSDDPEHVKWCLHWYAAVGKVLSEYQLTRKPVGGKGVIMVQIENEYNAHSTSHKEDFLRSLYGGIRKAGVEVPIFTCLTSECRGSKDSVLRNVFDAENLYVGLKDAYSCALRVEGLRHEQPNAPAYVTELQGGWFSTVKGRLSEENYSDYRHYRALELMSILGGATGLNTYMFVGGTNFAGWGARGMTTTYDYNAPIRENGSTSEKYEEASEVGTFIHRYESALIHSKGGPCAIGNAPKSLFGGVRVAPDGTQFIFLHNNDPKEGISGTATLEPGRKAGETGPMYNIDQDGRKVLVKTGAATGDSSAIDSISVKYNLGPLDTKVLVIPPGKDAASGNWWFMASVRLALHPAGEDSRSVPPAIWFHTVMKRNQAFDLEWQETKNRSLPEMGVNDCRYVMYRSDFSLKKPNTFTRLLFNTYSRDIINVQVNGKIAKRLAPSEQYAAEATRNVDKSFTPIGEGFDNAFDVTGLLKDGNNEIIALYENIGHEHGYIPMEELCGIRKAGLSDTLTEITQPLDWQVATDELNGSGQSNGQRNKTLSWEAYGLDTTMAITRKSIGGQPTGVHDALMTWYKAEFALPNGPQPEKWRLLINASGNGYIYLNGHNLGRYWEIGPQREFYLPECWLHFGEGQKNVITLGLCQTDNGAVLKAMEVAPYE